MSKNPFLDDDNMFLAGCGCLMVLFGFTLHFAFWGGLIWLVIWLLNKYHIFN